MSAPRFRPHGGVLRRMRRFIEDRRGVGAVEFAIVAPLLIMTYVGAFEISVAMTVARKVSRASSVVSDLLTQTQSTSRTSLDTMQDVAKSILAPFSAGDDYTLRITGIAIATDGTATTAWSRDQDGNTPYAKNSPVTLPAGMVASDTFIVRTELSVPHTILLMLPGLKSTDLSRINLSKTSYFHQRVGKPVECSDCG